jgi:hypothetical protein
MNFFPRVRALGHLDPDVRASAVDYVNRVNWLFETWDLEAMIGAFAPDAKVFHFHGALDGAGDIRAFLTETYPYLVPGVSRHASNHIVDLEGNGLVSVRYQNLLVRHATPEASAALGAGQVIETHELPAIWLYSPMLDRLRATDEGWKITERYIGGSATNTRYTPADISSEAMQPFLPKI